MPKFVGKPHKGHTKTIYELIKLDKLNTVADGTEVDYALLMGYKEGPGRKASTGVVTKENKGRDIYKVIGSGELTAKNLIVKAHAFTESAKAAIEANGGKCVILSPSRHIPIEEALAHTAELDKARLEKLIKLRALKAVRDAAKLSV